MTDEQRVRAILALYAVGLTAFVVVGLGVSAL